MKAVVLAFIGLIFWSCSVPSDRLSENVTSQPYRTVICTDGEIDDINSFIRLLLYANELDIVGLIYTSSQWHYAGDGNGTLFTSELEYTANRYGARTDLRWVGTNWMQDVIGKYGEVHNNLLQHDDQYPTPESLLDLIRIGNIEFEGAMEKDTEGSDFIKDLLLDDDTTSVYFQIWGGTNTVARTLKSIELAFMGTPEWPTIQKKVSDKTILYIVLDQDATYRNYISTEWPDVKVYYNTGQFWSLAYFWPDAVTDADKMYLEGEWISQNLIQSHGPLMSEYYTWGDGRQLSGDNELVPGKPDTVVMAGRKMFDFISEGDSPSFLHILNVGLSNPADPSFGGWGGRLERSGGNRWADRPAVADFNPYINRYDTSYAQTRWIKVIQNDFASRADWCVLNYNEGNHPPLVDLNHSDHMGLAKGESFTLSASATDPDSDTVSYRWWPYKEAGTYQGEINIQDPEMHETLFTIPQDANSGQSIHMILEVTDSGTPPLTRYRRVIIEVE